MSILDRVVALSERLLTEAIVPGMPQIDSDDDQFRRITKSKRDLNTVEHNRMLDLAAYLYDRNPIARRLIDVSAEWCLGEGLSVVASDEKDETLTEVLRRFWTFPINDWKRKGEQRFKDYRLYGELCWTVDEMSGSGTLVLGIVDPERIESVDYDAAIVDEAVSVTLKPDTEGNKRRFKVIRYDPKADALDDNAAGYDGKCFYAKINSVSASSRGRSDLFALMDYLDGADQFIWAQLERAKIANAMVFDVTVDGGAPEVAAEERRIREKNVTRPGGVNVHTKSIEWEIKQPTLGSTDAETMARLIMRVVLGGAGLPEYMFADAGNTNRATAAEQGDPVTKRMTGIQNDWCAVIDKVLRYQYQRAAAKNSDLKPLKLEDEVPWKIVKPDISAKDLAKLGSVVSQAVTALREAEAGGYISTETARVAFLTLAKLIGVNADPAAEAEKIAKQPKPDPVMDLYGKTPNGALKDAVDGQNAKANEQATQAGRQKTEGEVMLELARELVESARPEPVPTTPAATVNVNATPDMSGVVDAVRALAEREQPAPVVQVEATDLGPIADAIRESRPVVNVEVEAAAPVVVPAPAVTVMPAPVQVTEAAPRPTRTRKRITQYDDKDRPTEIIEERE